MHRSAGCAWQASPFLSSPATQRTQPKHQRTSCRFLRVTGLLSRKRSIRLTVRYSVSGMSLNLRCTSTSQSIRMARMRSLMSACTVQSGRGGGEGADQVCSEHERAWRRRQRKARTWRDM